MKKNLKVILLVGVATTFAPIAFAPISFATTAFATTAFAQTAPTDGSLIALDGVVDQLRDDFKAERAQPNMVVAVLDQTPQQPSPPLTQPKKTTTSSFDVGDTTFKFGGYIDLDAHVTRLSDGTIGSSSIARDFYIPSATPVAIGSAKSTTVTDFTAQASRLTIAGSRGTGKNKATGYMEMDFLGSFQGNERVSNSFSPRLRRAYFDYKNFRAGQEWSTFQNTSAIPESASFLVLSDGMVFMRQPIIRYTSGGFQVALESGNATITPATGTGRIEADGNLIPDAIMRYNFKGHFGNLSLSGIGRQLRLETGTSADDSTFGFGANVAGRIRAGRKSDIRFQVAAGQGMGRYIGLNALNGAAINPKTGNLKAIPSYGGYMAYRHMIGKTGRLNLGYSALFSDNPNFLIALNPRSTKNVQSAYVAYLWDVAPKITIGVEGVAGIKTLEDNTSGDLSQITFSTKYGF